MSLGLAQNRSSTGSAFHPGCYLLSSDYSIREREFMVTPLPGPSCQGCSEHSANLLPSPTEKYFNGLSLTCKMSAQHQQAREGSISNLQDNTKRERERDQNPARDSQQDLNTELPLWSRRDNM